MAKNGGKVVSAKPIGFEPGDSIDDAILKKDPTKLSWNTTTDGNDSDGMIITLDYPKFNSLTLSMHPAFVSFRPIDALLQPIEFGEGNYLDGKLTVKGVDFAQRVYSKELLALRDIMRPGRGSFNVTLESLFQGYKDGSFQEKNPLSTYPGQKEFVSNIWRTAQGAEWQNLETVMERLSTPELVELYLSVNFAHTLTYYPQDSKTTFKRKLGDCKAYAIFAHDALAPKGYNVSLYTMDPKSPNGHTILLVDRGKEGMYTLTTSVNASIRQGLVGPFKSFTEIDRAFGYAGRPSINETKGGLFNRFMFN